MIEERGEMGRGREREVIIKREREEDREGEERKIERLKKERGN